MDNVIGSLLSGFGAILGKIFGHPFDFLAGKSCSKVCGPTWDLSCYIENFCISHLLKLAMLSILSYFALLFLYLQYKLGIYGCICHMLCRSTWTCLYTCFSVLDCCCNFLCFKQKKTRSRRHQIIRDIEEEGELYQRKNEWRKRSKRDQRKEHFRRFLRAKSHKKHRQHIR
ncbi:hypothetical protein MTR67_027851 [Solanum verrucosum]|uniref:Uncharacterized protein n=1 Tax=Solanum verrucosum TaxID=315347 RepID=A0AAF0R9X9_SOLVR|nr:hypothetical protein MTR67_027851 [Solanum verrucosum]